LSRSLAITGVESRVIGEWVNGSREITRESFRDAVVPISDDASVLMPPDGIAESIDLICHTDGVAIAERILEVTKSLYDVVIVDTAGQLGPATGALLRAAETVLVVLDDGVLGLTAVDLFLDFVKTLVGSTDKIVFLVNSFTGAYFAVSQIASQLEPGHRLGGASWRLPPIPYEPKAALWPGTGRTLYSLGSPILRDALTEAAVELGIVDRKLVNGSLPEINSGKVGWLKRMLGRKNGVAPVQT
jgi:hypothetical protein